MTAAIVGALVGGVVAYAGGWFQQFLRHCRERKALASIVLQELRALERSMRDLYEHMPYGRLPATAFPILRERKDAIRVFGVDTVAKLLNIGGLLDAILEVQDQVQGGVLDPDHATSSQVRGHAYAIVHRIAASKTALEGEGGKAPDWAPIRAPSGLSAANWPELAAPAFAERPT